MKSIYVCDNNDDDDYDDVFCCYEFTVDDVKI